MASDKSNRTEGDDQPAPVDNPADETLDAPDPAPAAAGEIPPDDHEEEDSLSEMPVFSRDAPEELLQWLSLSLNQLRRRSGRMGENVSIVDKLLSSLKGLRLVGYGMVALIILDFASLLLDAQVMNPGWEWSFFGATVERSAVLLLGVALVLLGHENLRDNLERYFLQAVYWGSLGAGLAYLLMLPLGVANSYRLHDFYQQQYNSTYSAVELQYQKVLAAINAQQPADMAPPATVGEQAQARRKAATEQAAREASQMKLQAERQLAGRRAILRRQSMSWLGGSLLVGIIFLVLWHQARWVRDCTPRKVIRPWLNKFGIKTREFQGQQRKKPLRPRPKTTGAGPISHTTRGAGAQPGLKPAIRRKRDGGNSG